MSRRLGLFLLAMPLVWCTGCREETSATENYYLRGADGVGVVLASSGESVRVERESLTFDLTDAEENRYGNAIAEYEFVNEGAEDVVLTMFLPFGRTPEYDVGTDGRLVTAEGEEVTCRLRHTFAGSGEFSLDDVRRLSDERRADSFYSSDLPVTEYAFAVNVPEEGNFGFEVIYHCNPNKTQIAFSETAHTGLKNGWAKAFFPLTEGQYTVSMYAFGAPPSKYEFGIYEEGKGLLPTPAVSETVRTETFADFVMRDYGEGNIAEVDYYNAYVDMLNAYAGSYALGAAISDFGAENCMAWYEYSLNVPAGGKVTNTVKTPLYPDVSNKNGGLRYDYDYRLSPMHLFGECGSLDISVLTDKKLSSPSFAFSKTESGYGYICEFLPQGELAFTVSDFDCAGGYKSYGEVPPVLTTAFVMLAVVLVGAVTLVVVLAVRKRRGRAEPPQNGRTEEGKVDLDGPDE